MKQIKPCGIMVAEMLRSGVLSDEDYKNIEEADPQQVAKGILHLGKPYSSSELQYLNDMLGEEKYGYAIKDAPIWKDEILAGYMRHLYNYHYKYKPEAVEIDPDIDPDEEHIGIMAQDVEPINPAVVKETPEGVKTVDTGRAVLMDMGAIAELARQVAKVQEFVGMTE